jgi:Flp pilus assembly protein TadB
LNQQHKNRQIPVGNPLASLLVLVVGALTIALSVVVGFFAFVVLAGMVLILATFIGIRAWWFSRQQGSRARTGDFREPSETSPTAVIEGEYKVIEREKRRDPPT